MSIYSYTHIIVQAFENIVDIAKILSDETRVKILGLLVRNPDGICVYEIAEAVGASHSATSHQLAKLEAKEIVECYRDGQKMCYEFSDTRQADDVKRMLQSLSR